MRVVDLGLSVTKAVGFKKDIFTSWFGKFMLFSRESNDNPMLLIPGGHKSHTINLDNRSWARKWGAYSCARFEDEDEDRIFSREMC